MSQTLKAFTALSSPVVVTDSKTLVWDLAAVANLAPVQLKAINILGMIYSLAAVVGKTNYKTKHAQLIQDATSFMGGISLVDDGDKSQQVEALDAVVSWDVGFTTGSGLSADVNTLLAEARDLIALPAETLNRLYYFLFYSLAL